MPDFQSALVVDPALRVLFVSADFGVRIGLPEQPLPESPLPDLSLNADPPGAPQPSPFSGSLRDQAMRVLQTGQPLQLTSARLLIDGQERGPFQLSILPLVEAAGSVAALVRLQRPPMTPEAEAGD